MLATEETNRILLFFSLVRIDFHHCLGQLSVLFLCLLSLFCLLSSFHFLNSSLRIGWCLLGNILVVLAYSPTWTWRGIVLNMPLNAQYMEGSCERFSWKKHVLKNIHHLVDAALVSPWVFWSWWRCVTSLISMLSLWRSNLLCPCRSECNSKSFIYL